MDEGAPAVSRTDAAHIYSTLTTPAAFHYGGGDLFLSNTSPDSGAAFITSFTFTETPNATTVIGSEPRADGTRLIMIMVSDKKPDGTPLDLAALTPQVECAPGSSITSPLPAVILPPALATGLPKPLYTQGEIDFTNPTIWTAQAKNGATQRYTVVVSKAPSTATEKRITYFFFQDYGNYPGIIDETAHTIHVILPADTTSTTLGSLTPMISILGKSVVRWDGSIGHLVDEWDFSSADTTPVDYRVYAENSPSNFQDYAVTVDVALPADKVITKFAIDGYPDVSVVINDGGDLDAEGSITAVLPYGVSLTNLTPLIQYKGLKLDPASGTARNFSAPVYYTVTAQNTTTKTYKVTLTNEPANTDTGIFDFVITRLTIKEVPAVVGPPVSSPAIPAKTYPPGTPPAKVVIGQKPRQDGKIPIVIQVPYGTDEENLISAITLKSASSTISPASGKITFTDQEAVYTVTAQDGTTTQQYVVVVSQDVQYYYVDAKGSDNWPDLYNGGSEGAPFRTLAYAIYRASRSGSTVNKIFVTGELNAASEATSTHNTDSGSVITIDGTTWGEIKTITVTGTGNGATLRGTSGKRVLSVTGGAELVFENITVTGGSTSGKGGGISIAGNSNVKFSGGSITGNTALSGGGVYIEGTTDSKFSLMGGTISNNTATGNNATDAAMDGGGGVYVKGNAVFWLAGGTVSNNTATRGAGGGVLINGNSQADGFLMSGGTISGNRAPAGVYPHGGGGVYVAKGTFEMLEGSITGNYSNRQGGGVFVHWGGPTSADQPLFYAAGDSIITGNDGVGSSKGICNRGITELAGRAQTDTVYVWDYDESGIAPQSFTLGGNARIGGIVLAFSATDRNYLTIASSVTGSDQICRIDLEGHLTGGLFKDFTPAADWITPPKKLITGNGTTLTTLVNSKRIVLGTFTGNKTIYLTAEGYSIDTTTSSGQGKLKK
jgi:hypothetical protein